MRPPLRGLQVEGRDRPDLGYTAPKFFYVDGDPVDSLSSSGSSGFKKRA